MAVPVAIPPVLVARVLAVDVPHEPLGQFFVQLRVGSYPRQRVGPLSAAAMPWNLPQNEPVQRPSLAPAAVKHGSSMEPLQLPPIDPSVAPEVLSEAFVFALKREEVPQPEDARGKWQRVSSRKRHGSQRQFMAVRGGAAANAQDGAETHVWTSSRSAPTSRVGEETKPAERRVKEVVDSSLFLEVTYLPPRGSEQVSVGAAVVPLFWLEDEMLHDSWIPLSKSGELGLPAEATEPTDSSYAPPGSVNAELLEKARSTKGDGRIRLHLQYLFSEGTDIGAEKVLCAENSPQGRFLDWLIDDLAETINGFPPRNSLPQPRIPIALSRVVDSADADKLANALVACFDYRNRALPLLKTAIEEEIFGACERATEATNVEGTLFRGNSIAVKMVSRHARRCGQHFIDTLITPLVREVVSNPPSCELDPSRIADVSNLHDDLVKLRELGETLKINEQNLRELAERFLDLIVKSLDAIPDSIKISCGYFRWSIEEAARRSSHISPSYWRTAVGGFFFLRFVCPAISTSPVATNDTQRRPLILVTKCLQNLASGVGFAGSSQKEQWMAPMDPFIAQNAQRLDRFFQELTLTPPSVQINHSRSAALCLKEVQTLANMLQTRKEKLTEHITEDFAKTVEPMIALAHLDMPKVQPRPFTIPPEFLREQGCVRLTFRYDVARGHPIGVPRATPESNSGSQERKVKSGKKSKEKLHLVVLNDVSLPKVKRKKTSRIVSMKMPKGSTPTTALEDTASISIEVAARFFALYSRYSFERRNSDGRSFSTNWPELCRSSEYLRALSASKRLKPILRLKGDEIPDATHRKAIFLNLFNALALHVCCHERKSWEELLATQPLGTLLQTYCYDIGGTRFSLSDIRDGILRANKPSDGNGAVPFADERVAFSLEGTLDPRIHFGLAFHGESSPHFQVYHPNSVDEQLRAAASLYLEHHLEVDLAARIAPIRVPGVFLDFFSDFGGEVDSSRDSKAGAKAMLAWTYPYLSPDVRARVSEQVAADDMALASGDRTTDLIVGRPYSFRPVARPAGLFGPMFAREGSGNEGEEDLTLSTLKRGDFRTVRFQLQSENMQKSERGTIVVTSAPAIEDVEELAPDDENAYELETLFRILDVVGRMFMECLQSIYAIKERVQASSSGTDGPARQQQLTMFAQILQHISHIEEDVRGFLAGPGDGEMSDFSPFCPDERILGAEYNPDVVQKLESLLGSKCDYVAKSLLAFQKEVWGPYRVNAAAEGSVSDDVVAKVSAVTKCFRAMRYALQFHQFEVES